MSPWLDDLRTRIQLSEGSASLLLLIADQDGPLDEVRRLLLELLRITPLAVADLGAVSVDTGPRRWVELTAEQGTSACLLSASSTSPLGLKAMARRYNAERELLRQLAGPMVLVVSAATEKAIRQEAPDFFTWVAQSYELPSLRALAALAKQLGVAAESVDPKVPDEDPIRFLHISDIHLRPQAVKRYDQDRVLRGLVDFLAEDRAVFPLDLIFVTGDLAFSGKAEEYVLVVELLTKLMEVTGVPKEHVFVVPGNHDIDRDIGRWLLRTLGKDEEAIAFFTEPKNRALHLKKLDAYASSMRALLGENRPLGLAVGEESVELVQIRGARLAVVSLSSAWFALGDDDNGKLWLGEPSVNLAGQQVADLEAPFAVALLHHPFNELHEIERDTVEKYVERSFDLVLRGHLHKDKTRSIATQRGGFVEVAGPAAYQGSQWANGCFLGEIRVKARAVRLRPHAYASGSDAWVLDTKVFPDDAIEGYCHTFVVPEKRRLKSAVTRRLERAVGDTVRAASPAQQRKVAEELGVAKRGMAAPPNMAQQTAKAARSQAHDAIVSQSILGLTTSDAQSRALAAIMGEEVLERGGPLSSSDPASVEQALLKVGHAFLRAKVALGFPGITVGVAMNGLSSAFSKVLNQVSVAQVQFAIFLGFPGKTAVINVIQATGSHQERTVATGIAALDRYFATHPYTHGALILLDALHPSATEPQLEHVTTPAGRDVLLLRL